MKLFTVKAGRQALEVIRDRGLEPESVKTVAGAAGGPKWIVLGGLDRYLFGRFFQGRREPLYCVGSSIGAWRFSAAARKDPLAALDSFRQAYFAQAYSNSPDPEEVTRESQKVMDCYLPENAVDEILQNPFMRLSFLAVRSRRCLSSDRRKILLPGLAAAGIANVFSRRAMGLFFSRAFFYDSRDLPSFYSMSRFPIERVSLTRENLRRAVLASGSIPLVMEGIKGIPGTRGGTYRDGGMIDYHLDIPFNTARDEIVLFPHFIDRIVPGWFDKNLSWRGPQREHTANLLLVSPSQQFIEALSRERIPDRHDFRYYAGHDADRISAWDHAFSLGLRLADEFAEAVESGKIRTMVEPL